MRNLWAALFVFLFATGCTNVKTEDVNLIPLPAELTMLNGQFVLNADAKIYYAQPELAVAATYLQEHILKQTGFSLSVVEGADAGKNISLLLNSELGEKDQYALTVNDKGVCLEGSNPRGVILGIQTIRQLLPQSNTEGKSSIGMQAMIVKDEPAWEWRGMMMDDARHFFDKEEVKRFLDMMALYKFNKFHWHLTDDQGWRVEIKKYPLLTENGAWRTYNKHDRTCMKYAKNEHNPDYELPEKRLRPVENDTIVEYGGFYTQEDIREVIAYAADRGIDVIPEVDMPGHFSAAIKVYPELACFNQASWGRTFSAPICPGKDATLQFCKDVYAEIFELFPYPYIHMGADEVEKDNWLKCPNCKARIKKEKLKDEKELQSWFVKEMKAFFDGNGKKLIGWDEIIEGGLPEGAVVMFWRPWAPTAVDVATSKHSEVILTPNSHYYFDFKQDDQTLFRVYDFDPVPEGLTDEQKKYILGVQANSWAEYIPSYQRLEYMVMPRMAALSEVAWNYSKREEWNKFYQRLIPHFSRWDVMKINYRPLDLKGSYLNNAFIGSTEVTWNNPLPNISIYYTTDGSIPTKESTLYTGPFTINETTDFTLRFYRPDGTAADIIKMSYRKEEYRSADKPENVEQGLALAWHEGIARKCEEIEKLPLKQNYVVDGIVVPEDVNRKRGLIYSGYIKIDKDGVYTFTLGSDDGSMLYVGDDVVVDNDGPHGPVTISGQKALAAGYQPITLYYFDMNNGGFISLKVLDSDGNEIELSGDRLWHTPH
ncbi:family 20 glycosylhydrolase [Bacteroides sp. 224]|uniref:family 20 glycosylhydrolase n=1 Tax=Bacteroides sp. 224 TaxID=2302936 RepID=UPI0013D8AEF9|nr:family 20 glycosylhydrolase [Bacteroides sp. 224]